MPEGKSSQHLAAERKTREILDEVFYNTNSLTHALVKAHRNGMPPEGGTVALNLIIEACEKAKSTYKAAIAQPENKMAARPEVNL